MFICVLRGRKVYGGIATTLALVAGCGGGDDYANKPRPPAPINVTAAITNSKVSVSPQRFGAGPIVLIVTNQTGASQEVTFESNELGASKPGVTQTTEPINPRGTGQLQVNVTEGRYRVRAANADIAPATITVGPERQSAQNQLLQP